MSDNYQNVSREGLIDMLEEAMGHMQTMSLKLARARKIEAAGDGLAEWLRGTWDKGAMEVLEDWKKAKETPA